MTTVHQIPFGPDYGFGLYVHWPYCSKICPYCDFNVYAAKDRETDMVVDGLVKDIQDHRARLPEHGALDTIYFGGGTPGLMRPDQVARVVQAARDTFGQVAFGEVTLEANPNDIMRLDLDGLKAAGINRLSIGVQSLRPDVLKFLGRDHDAQTAIQAVQTALSVFPNTSIDLIYAIPGQTVDAWHEELETALSLGAPHLSLYELTIEPRTVFGKAVERGQFTPMGDDAQADLYEETQRVADKAGLRAYEVSNHARAPEYQSRHNLIYWQGGDWIGVGPGAHGRLTVNGQRYATEAHKKPDAYLANVQTVGNGWDVGGALEPLDVARELLAMGLRSTVGIDIGRIQSVSGQEMDAAKVNAFIDEGWLVQLGSKLVLTPSGRLLADAISVALSP